MTTLCTLFDHNYLDKGLVMYESLEKVCDEFELYVLAMSDRCYEILTDLNYPHLKPIKLEDFEDEELLKVKQSRNAGEYCWTCGSCFVRYILMTYKPEYCAYIDADLYFYSDPKVVVEEMKRRKASVQITGHRFDMSLLESAERQHLYGKYCVEYNTFKNDEKGLLVVNRWRKQCLESCSTKADGNKYGDQKYLDNWCEDYDFVIETENLGMGVAPWNIDQYRLVSKEGNYFELECRKNKYILVFYHYQGITYINSGYARMNVESSNAKVLKLSKLLYKEYLRKIDAMKNFISARYEIYTIIKHHPAFTQESHYTFVDRLINIVKHPIAILNKYCPLYFQPYYNNNIVRIK